MKVFAKDVVQNHSVIRLVETGEVGRLYRHASGSMVLINRSHEPQETDLDAYDYVEFLHDAGGIVDKFVQERYG